MDGFNERRTQRTDVDISIGLSVPISHESTRISFEHHDLHRWRMNDARTNEPSSLEGVDLTCSDVACFYELEDMSTLLSS